MSGLSPARRLRTKTTDFSDFFRGNISHGQAQASTSNTSYSTTPAHDANQLFDPVEMSTSSAHSQSAAKKFSSKLPFLGRSRKKSNVEESSANAARERERDRSSPPQAVGKHETVQAAHQTEAHSDSIIRPTKSRDGPQQSLGSKFAAHFTPSRPRKSDASSRKFSSSPSKPRQPPAESTQPDGQTLHPPPKLSPRGRSFESTSSGASEKRSTTPRPSQSQRDSQQPTFTVTLSPPDDLSIYADLFTRPRRKTDSSSQVHVSASSSSSTPTRDSDEQNTADQTSRSSSQSTSPGTRTSTPPNGLGTNLTEDYDQTSGLEDTPVRPGSRSSVKSTGGQTHQKTDSEDGRNLLSELRFSEDSVIDKERPFPNPPSSHPSSPIPERRRTLSRPATQSSEKGTIGVRSGRARSASGSRPSAPPSIPLPSPPLSTGSPLPSPPPSVAPTPPPNFALPSVPTATSAPSRKSVSSISSISSSSQSAGFLSRRTRAHTVPSVPPLVASSTPSTPSVTSSPVPPTSNPPPPSSFAASPYLKSLKHDYMATDSEKSDWDRSDWDRSDIDDINHATPDQLKQVVISLKAYVKRIVEDHEHERNEMRQKIEALERESIRKDDEIKGLKYLVHRGGGAPFGAASPRAGSPRTSSARSSPLATPSNTSFSDTEVKMPMTRRRVAIASGTQSDTGRGAMTSDSEIDAPSSIPMLPPSLRRNKTAFGTSSPKPAGVAVRSTSTRCIPIVKSSPSVPPSPDLNSPSLLASGLTNKRASTASTFSMASTTSSSSSLLPASSVAPSTISSNLSSIPESPPSSSPRQPVLPAILQTHHQQVLSTPKPASKRTPALTPAAAYAANLKTGRPPSIQQVLERENGAGPRSP